MWLLIIIVIALLGWFVMVYNQLQAMMQEIREQLSNLQAALKKRIDLANQIVEIAQGYTDHERLTYAQITNNQNALGNLRALAQDYPQLRANETYQNLMDKLENIENVILSRRENYNAAVRQYNSARNRFPAVLIAQKLSFAVAPYYEIDDPDFLEKVKMFERDDSETLQKLVGDGAKAIGQKAQQAGDIVKQKIDRNPHDDNSA